VLLILQTTLSEFPNDKAGLQVEGILAYFTHLKCQKRIGDDVGDFKYVSKCPDKGIICVSDLVTKFTMQ
jgi:hypothetical protein